jgi:hypothetical protein
MLLLGAVGVLLFLVGALAATEAQAALMLAIAGSIVVFVAVYQLWFMVRCPRCGENVGSRLFWPLGRWLDISSRIRHCPSCAVDLDADLPEEHRT